MAIPEKSMEIERLFHHCRNTQNKIIVLCSSEPGEGATSVAHALTQRMLLSGCKTLLIDFNMHNPSIKRLIELDNSSKSESHLLPALVSVDESFNTVVGVPAPQHTSDIMRLRDPIYLRNLYQDWRKEFDYIVIDGGAINRRNKGNIPAEHIAACADACYLVVEAGSTHAESVEHAVTTLSSSQVNLAGTIINDQYFPDLKRELLRQIEKLPVFLRGIKTVLQRWVISSQFLSIED